MSRSTRNRIVEAARALFAQKGYASTSIAEIARHAKANPGSVYFFFPMKQDVLLAVLDTYRSGIRQMLLAPAWQGVQDPIDRVFALLDLYRTLLVNSGCAYGCPIGILALELHEPDPPVRKALAANFEAWIRAIEECLVAAGPRLPREVDRRTLATFVLTTMEGAVMQARTFGSLAPYDASIAVLRDHFTRLERDATEHRPRRRARRNRKTARRRA